MLETAQIPMLSGFAKRITFPWLLSCHDRVRDAYLCCGSRSPVPLVQWLITQLRQVRRVALRLPVSRSPFLASVTLRYI